MKRITKIFICCFLLAVLATLFTSICHAENLVDNPGFEQEENNFPLNWEKWSGKNGSEVHYDKSEAHTGNKSMLITQAKALDLPEEAAEAKSLIRYIFKNKLQGESLLYKNVPVMAEKKYYFSFWFKTSGLLRNNIRDKKSGYARFSVWIHWLDDKLQDVGGRDFRAEVANEKLNYTDWIKLSDDHYKWGGELIQPYMAPPGAKFAQIRFQLVTAAADVTPKVWIDDVSLTEAVKGTEKLTPQDMTIQYKGPLVTDTIIPGEGKSAGMTPEISSCVQVSKDKWLILFGTVDPRGTDTNRSIFYQLRKGSSNGKVLKEGIIEKAKSNWDPLGVGHKFRKINAVVKVFGVPKGALRNGKPLPTANHFVAKWYTRSCMEINGRLVNLWERESPVHWRELGIYAYCLEWMQFRLNDAEDDIEIISPTKQLRQKGYDQKRDIISSLGPCKGMHHGFGDAVPNDNFSEWVEICQFEKKMAAVRYSFNETSGLYEWVETGKEQQVPGRFLAEASLNKINKSWVICIRAYDQEGQTAWYRTSDPFESFGDKTDVKCTYTPRIAFVCADGKLRLFTNEPYGGYRNPLYCFDVDPITFKYSNRRVVLDTRKERLPFRQPTIDHAMIYPHAGGRRQIISFRAISRAQTTVGVGSIKPGELEKSGIHYSELIYDKEYPSPWTFE